MASATFLLLGLVLNANGQVKANASIPAWDSVRHLVGTAKSSQGVPLGVAVPIDPSGLLLLRDPGKTFDQVTVTLSGPITLNAARVGSDEVTGLAVFAAKNWPTDRPFARVGIGEPYRQGVLIVATASGPTVGQAVGGQRAGRLAGTNRYVPLTELRLEQTVDQLGGAAIFDDQGQLMGLLGATLVDSSMNIADFSQQVRQGSPLVRQEQLQNYGPQGVTTGYVLSTKALRRVVAGFTSPDRVVRYPVVGLSFADNNGVVVTKVAPGSAAAKAGITQGDRIVSFDGKQVGSSVKLATMLFDLEVGSQVQLEVLRGEKRMKLSVLAGS